MPKQYWLIKSEPTTFSIDDLKSRPQQIEHWEGVRNYQARNYMKEMRVGDEAFFYHSSCPVPGIVGIVKITRAAYPDHFAFDPKSKYFDPKSTPEHPRWFMVDVAFKSEFDTPVSLTTLKSDKRLQDLPCVKTGSRLSVMPIPTDAWRVILSLRQ